MKFTLVNAIAFFVSLNSFFIGSANGQEVKVVKIDELISLLENGETIHQQTRSFDASNDTTFAIRDKEEANDYRYFPDPDLAPFVLSESYIDLIMV